MKRTSFAITQGNGETKHVAGYLCGETGLVVHKDVSYWYVTHLPSGLSATPRKVVLKTRKEAFRFVRCLTEKLDFSVEKPDFSFSKDIQPMIERFKQGYDPDA